MGGMKLMTLVSSFWNNLSVRDGVFNLTTPAGKLRIIIAHKNCKIWAVCENNWKLSTMETKMKQPADMIRNNMELWLSHQRQQPTNVYRLLESIWLHVSRCMRPTIWLEVHMTRMNRFGHIHVRRVHTNVRNGFLVKNAEWRISVWPQQPKREPKQP